MNILFPPVIWFMHPLAITQLEPLDAWTYNTNLGIILRYPNWFGSSHISNKHLWYPNTRFGVLVFGPNIFGNNFAIFAWKHIRCIKSVKWHIWTIWWIAFINMRHKSNSSMRNIMSISSSFSLMAIINLLHFSISFLSSPLKIWATSSSSLYSSLDSSLQKMYLGEDFGYTFYSILASRHVWSSLGERDDLLKARAVTPSSLEELSSFESHSFPMWDSPPFFLLKNFLFFSSFFLWDLEPELMDSSSFFFWDPSPDIASSC